MERDQLISLKSQNPKNSEESFLHYLKNKKRKRGEETSYGSFSSIEASYESSDSIEMDEEEAHAIIKKLKRENAILKKDFEKEKKSNKGRQALISQLKRYSSHSNNVYQILDMGLKNNHLIEKEDIEKLVLSPKGINNKYLFCPGCEMWWQPNSYFHEEWKGGCRMSFSGKCDIAYCNRAFCKPSEEVKAYFTECEDCGHCNVKSCIPGEMSKGFGCLACSQEYDLEEGEIYCSTYCKACVKECPGCKDLVCDAHLEKSHKGQCFMDCDFCSIFIIVDEDVDVNDKESYMYCRRCLKDFCSFKCFNSHDWGKCELENKI